MVYSHLNFLIRKKNLDMLFVVGPGHGAPAILAALWLEGSLEKFYPQYSHDREGLHRLISTFSTTAGLPRLVAKNFMITTEADSFSQSYQCGNPWVDSRRWRARLCVGRILRRSHG